MSIIIGFDTGWNKVNYAVIEKVGHEIELCEYKQHSINIIAKDYDSNDEYISAQAHAHIDIIKFIYEDWLTIGDNAFIEKPVHVNNGETTIKLSIAASAIYYLLSPKGVICEFVNNMEWKKQLIKGNCTKEDIRRYAQMIFSMPDLKPSEADMYDAALIAYYGTLRLKERAIKAGRVE